MAAFTLMVALMAFGASMVGAAALSKGTVEITPSLSFSHNNLSYLGADAGSITVFAGSGLIGYCVSDRIEVVGGLLVDHQSRSSPGSTSESATSLGASGGLLVNLALGGQMVPFVRAAIALATNSGTLSVGEQTTFIAPILEAGVRVLVGSSASVNFGLGYRHQSTALGLSDLAANTFAFEIGVSVFPRKGK